MISANISVVIPTFERRACLLKSLSYWSRYPVIVIVLDGSALRSVMAEELIGFKNVDYYHLPTTLEKRFLFCASRITTPYAALLSDDEFFLYSSLVSACKVLETDSGVSAVVGATLGFTFDIAEIRWRYEYKTIKNLRMKSTTPSGRLLDRKRTGGNSIMYSLSRSEVLVAALRFAGQSSYSCPYIVEYQIEASFCWFGEVRFIPFLMWVRNRAIPFINLESSPRDVLFEEWLKDPDNRVAIERLKSSIHTFSLDHLGEGRISPQDFLNIYGRDPRFIAILKKFIPDALHPPLRFLRRSFAGGEKDEFFDLEIVTRRISADGISIDEAELEVVKSIILGGQNETRSG